jgi:oligopeptide transport system substrate-binding protein
MRIATVGDPQTLDPRYARELFSVHHVHLLYQGLFRKNRAGETVPALCESYQISGLTYQFKLRRCFWSNGEPVVAQDFVRSWSSVIASQAPFAYQFSGIASFEEEGENMLKVNLKYPDASFLEILTTNSFFPVHPQMNVYCGPFILKEWIPHNHLIVAKNPIYWDAAHIDVDEIQFEKLHDMVALRLFEQGKIDWIGSPLANIPLDAVQFIHPLPSFSDSMATRFIRINVERVDLQMRKILFQQVDRQLLVDVISKAHEKPAYTFLPPLFSMSEHIETRKITETLPRLKLIYIQSELNHLIAQLLERQWNIDLKACNAKVFYEHLEKKEYDLALGTWHAGTWDPLHFLEMLKYANETGWENELYKNLLDRAVCLEDCEVRKNLLKAAQTLLVEEVPIIPLYYPSFVHLCSSEYTNIKINPLGLIDFHQID